MKDEEWDTDATDATAELKKNVTNGTADGTATITIDPADTATLTPGTYFYDVKVEDADGNIYKIDEGKVKLDGSPSNRLA